MARFACAFAAVICVLALASVVAGAPAGNKIENLPGLATPLPFDMYSGYLTVNETAGRALFYWFVEAEESPESKPVMLWLQGGPGCSSLLGFFEEHGPLVTNADGTVQRSAYSWNGFANMLYIESPAGVGFSYSNTSSDYNTNNNKTALDNYLALQAWYKLFPEYNDNDLWVAGESYAGDYVPELVRLIVNGTDQEMASRLTGFMIGNPVMSCPMWKETANSVQVDLFYWHGMIPLWAYTEWKTSGCDVPNANPPASCNNLINEITNMVGPLDTDNLYMDLMTGNATLGLGPIANENMTQIMTTYLNRPDVQTAIHARPTSWVACCAAVGQPGVPCALNYTSNWRSQLPYYNFFFEKAPKLRILIYSGDVDIGTCPFAYTQLCLSALNRKRVANWQPWVMWQQTAGYIEQYDTYTYATVKGAGHEVPTFAPAAAYHMASHFIANEPF